MGTQSVTLYAVWENGSSAACTLLRLAVTGDGFSTAHAAPALRTGSLIAMGKAATSSISFVPTLLSAADGEAISYSWNGGVSVPILSGASSGELTLADGPGSIPSRSPSPLQAEAPRLTPLTLVKACRLSYRPQRSDRRERAGRGAAVLCGERARRLRGTQALRRSHGRATHWRNGTRAPTVRGFLPAGGHFPDGELGPHAVRDLD